MHIRDMTLGDEEPIQHVADTTWRSTYAGIFSREFIDEFLDKNYSPYVLRRAMTLAVPMSRLQ